MRSGNSCPGFMWPRLMRAETAAAYVDEVSVQAFRRKVGSVYPEPVLTGRGTQQKWDREQLDRVATKQAQQAPLVDAVNVI